MYYRILVASQRFHGNQSLTYGSPETLRVGQLVQVMLQNRPVIGIVESKTTKPSFATKPITRSWSYSVPTHALRLIDWLSGYYPAPFGMLVELFTPPAMPQKLQQPKAGTTKPQRPVTLPTLTPEQTKVIQEITVSRARSYLLHGDTGSGKTRVYLELAKQMLAHNKSVLVLTPEIGLTQPLVAAFAEQFGQSVVVTHSQMTAAERRNIWLRIAENIEPLVVIGPRSALFSPIKSLGIIIIDEAHDNAYKQEQAPYYQATRVAAQIAGLHQAKLVLGTATPLLADYVAFQQKNLPILRMTGSAITNTHVTEQQIIDQRNKSLFSRSPWISTPLLDAIDQALSNKEQVMLFLNRRGSARLILCDTCGWQAMCPHCDVPLTFHQDQHLMRCHSCDYQGRPPSICPECNTSELVFRSIGTKALETEMSRLYPKARIARYDRDTAKSDRLQHHHYQLTNGEIDIIIGTQAIAKGFDLPKLGVVGIINADSGLQLPDFSAAERSFQLISQVSGRVGRGHRAGRLFIQSYQPDSPLLRFALTKDYQSFVNAELPQRESYKFPPYYFLLKITCARATSKSAQTACEKIATHIKTHYPKVLVEGPSPRFIEKVAGRYAWHLVVKAKSRAILTDIAKTLPANTTYDLDPSDLL